MHSDEAILEAQGDGQAVTVRHTESGEFSSFRVFIKNFHEAVIRAIETTEETLEELRGAWNSIDWNSREMQHELARLHRALGIAINQLAHKDREMQRYARLLNKDFAHHKAHLSDVHASIALIRDEVARERNVEYEEREIHAEIREEEKRLHFMLRKSAVLLRREPDKEGSFDTDRLSEVYHVLEPLFVKIIHHEQKLLKALAALRADEKRAA